MSSLTINCVHCDDTEDAGVLEAAGGEVVRVRVPQTLAGHQDVLAVLAPDRHVADQLVPRWRHPANHFFDVFTQVLGEVGRRTWVICRVPQLCCQKFLDEFFRQGIRKSLCGICRTGRDLFINDGDGFAVWCAGSGPSP